MSEEYRVPKREVTAEVTVVGRDTATLKLFLSQAAQGHMGFERPSDLLNGHETFFPAVDDHGDLILLQREAVKVVSVATKDEMEDEAATPGSGAPAASAVEVEVMMEDASTISGTVVYVMPMGRTRLQDFLNTGDKFLPVRQGGMVHLINKQRIARITAL